MFPMLHSYFPSGAHKTRRHTPAPLPRGGDIPTKGRTRHGPAAVAPTALGLGLPGVALRDAGEEHLHPLRRTGPEASPSEVCLRFDQQRELGAGADPGLHGLCWHSGRRPRRHLDKALRANTDSTCEIGLLDS